MDIPLFISHRRLAHRRSLPRTRGPWCLDSGAFSEIQQYGRWTVSAEQYAAAVRRYVQEIGGLQWERDRMAERQEIFRGELERFRTQQLELLGLLAAVVAFVVSAASIAAQTPKTGDGARLICAMAGAVILVFASFTHANSRATWQRLLPVAVLGSALLLTGLLL